MDVGKILRELPAIVAAHWVFTLWAAGIIILYYVRGRRRRIRGAEDAPRTWQTHTARFLEDPSLINSTVRVLNGAIPGTNKQYDSHKVADELIQMLSAEL